MLQMRPALTLFSIMLLAACSEPSAPTTNLIRSANSDALPTHSLQRHSVQAETPFDGVVEAISQATVAAQTSGRVMALPFDVGDFVPQGAEIVRLTSREQAANVDSAESAISEARARLTEAKANFTRAQEVFAKKLIAKAEFDRVAANLRSAEARLNAAKAQLERAREALNYTSVRAPYPGTVLERHVQLGETVAPGTPLMTGLSLDQLRIVVNIPQQHIAKLRTHKHARLELPNGQTLVIEDFRIPPAANPNTHSFKVLIDLDSAPTDLYPGTLVKAAFITQKTEALLLPAAALVRRGELTAAYVLSPERLISLRYLRIGSPLPTGEIPVMAGLSADEVVITDPVAAAIAYKQQYTAESGQ